MSDDEVSLLDATIRHLLQIDYYHHLTVDEFVEDLVRQGAPRGKVVPAHYRRLMAARVRALISKGKRNGGSAGRRPRDGR